MRPFICKHNSATRLIVKQSLLESTLRPSAIFQRKPILSHLFSTNVRKTSQGAQGLTSRQSPLIFSRGIKSMKARIEIPVRPKLSHEETERINQGNISDFDIFQDLPTPMNTIEVVLSNGFRLKNGTIFRCRDPKNHPNALVLLATESFLLDLSPNPSSSKSSTGDKNASTPVVKGLDTGFVDFDKSCLEFLKVIHPKPEILVVGLGKKSRMLHSDTRKFITGLGIQIELSTTNIAANNYDLLVTERPGQIGALLLPPNI